MSEYQAFTKKAPRGDLSNPDCASREVFSHIMGKWGGLILRALSTEKVLRFAEIRDSVKGISEKVLAQTLKHLERDGLVVRHSYQQIPPKVEYTLTPVGGALAHCVKKICDLIERETLSIMAAQAAYDAGAGLHKQLGPINE